jgi:polysaccharide biosynthesis/export protein
MKRSTYLCLQSTFAVFFLLSVVFFSSCVSSKKAVYFNNIQDTILLSTPVSVEPVIQKSDLLNITVSSLNPEASMVFNTPNVVTPMSTNVGIGATGASTATTPISGTIGNSELMGYLVGPEGLIKFPVIGNIPAAGLTKKQLEQEITDSLTQRKLLVDPIINVRFLNFRVTVLGEVARPTTLNVLNERISIMEALGLAGDMTIFAKRDNVLLIREDGNNKIIKRLNLNSTSILTSPYYYLKTNDIVYVEPRSAKIASTSRAQQLLPAILSALALIAVVGEYYIKQ